MTVRDQNDVLLMNHEADDDVMVEAKCRVEVDDSYHQRHYAKVRIELAPNVYRVGTIMISELIDARVEYAKKRITAIDRQSEIDALPDLAQDWVARRVRISWPRMSPPGLQAGQVVTVVAADPATLTVSTDDDHRVTVAYAAFSFSDIDFERSKAEIDGRTDRLKAGETLTLMTVREAFDILSQVPVVVSYLGDPGLVDLTMAATAEEFEEECIRYLMRSARFRDRRPAAIAAQMVNGFTDHLVDRSAIWLRPGVQGVGTEVHEVLHAFSAKDFDRRATVFLNEGITEYLTRKAVGERFDRYELYTEENDFVSELIRRGAVTEAGLAALYFTSDWTAVDAGLRGYAGDLVALDTLWEQADSGRSGAALRYLDELAADHEAPLADYA